MVQVIDEKTKISRSEELFCKAQHYIPGGVNSPVRAFGAVGGTPPFIRSANGAYLIDEDGNEYIDYVGSWGPMVLGHAHPTILNAVHTTIEQGLSFGAPNGTEVELAAEICKLMPSIEKVRMVNSGTEAAMSAIRLARGFTSRDKILKFEGCYHGHADSLLVKSGSGLLTLGTPSSPGVPEGATNDTLVATYNDLDSVTALFEKYGQDIAAIIVEPIAGNMNMVLPTPGFLRGLRDVCDQYQSLLIFDEVITGFRVALGGAQSLFNIQPDLTVLGKIIGGGMPVGGYGGRHAIMDQISPSGAVYQAGTLSGNPVAMAAGLATLKEIQMPHFHDELNQKTKLLIDGILACAKAANVSLTANQTCGLFGLFFSSDETITNYKQVMNCDIERFNQYFHAMLNAGIYLAPSAFEAGFISSAHGKKEIAITLEAVEQALNKRD